MRLVTDYFPEVHTHSYFYQAVEWERLRDTSPGIILEKNKMTESADSPKLNELRAAHGHICPAQLSYVMSLECIYQISVAWLNPPKLQQAGCGKVQIAVPPSIRLWDVSIPKSGNRTYIFPLCVLLSWQPFMFYFCVCGS